jgi:hypothetical protein
MDPFFVFIVVVLVAVFAVAIRMDLRRRHLHDTPPGSVMSKASRRTRLEGREKGGRWSAGS